jgi:predicted nucleic acid-binding protein
VKACSRRRGAGGCASPATWIDTNVLARFVVNDDPKQARRARALVESFDVFVPTSVLPETKWALRSNTKITGPEISDALRAFLALPRVFAEDERSAHAALDWVARGMDFADALHLASSIECQAFASFDRGLARTAAKAGALTVRAP